MPGLVGDPDRARVIKGGEDEGGGEDEDEERAELIRQQKLMEGGLNTGG